ncbi:putative O-glycosylation ligase, exosortase A system-associated [Colwelliaceae bacterium 6471]
MTDLFILGIYLSFVVFGITRPYVAFAGYIWVDIIRPQSLAYGFLSGQPLSMMMAVLCIFSIIINFNKLKKTASFGIPLLLILFSLWITFTTFNAYFPELAWFKWDSAFKTIIMSLCLYFVINTKEQLEFCILTFSLSISYFIIASGLKSILGGGGYGASLISSGANTGLAESSTLAMVAVLLMPLVIFLKKHTLLLTNLKQYNFLWNLSFVVIVASVIGTRARTGLIALAVYAGIYIVKSKHKIRNSILVVIVAFLSFSFFVSDDWKQRMNTMHNVEQESSALGRILVWQWTWDFVKENPNGGGFNAFRANGGEWQQYADVPIEGTHIKAFHSIYFEVLGEHGYVGLILFLWLIFSTWRSNKSIRDKNRAQDEEAWYADLAVALNHCLLIFCAAGAFIGVAFQPIVFYLIAFSVLLKKIKHNNYA